MNTRSVHVHSGLEIIDETPRIKDRNHWGFISRVAGGIMEKEINIKEEN